MSHLIAPSILAADFLNLNKDIATINESNADYLHVDVMDGVFVPNISFGQSITSFMKSASTKPLDVHLMIVEPEKYISSFRDAGADIITVHLEACHNLHRTVQQIKDTGAKAGVAINPHSSISLVEDLIEDVDIFCLMSVNPGFGGQKFIHRTLDKIRRLKGAIIERNASAIIEVDGGVGLQNAELILKAGAQMLVAGSSVFKSNDPIDTIAKLKNVGLNNLV